MNSLPPRLNYLVAGRVMQEGCGTILDIGDFLNQHVDNWFLHKLVRVDLLKVVKSTSPIDIFLERLLL